MDSRVLKKLAQNMCELGYSLEERALAKALIELDTAVSNVLEASLSGEAPWNELHILDEVRGRIWATYSTPATVLKLADQISRSIAPTP